jgi:hypothetical protein
VFLLLYLFHVDLASWRNDRLQQEKAECASPEEGGCLVRLFEVVEQSVAEDDLRAYVEGLVGLLQVEQARVDVWIAATQDGKVSRAALAGDDRAAPVYEETSQIADPRTDLEDCSVIERQA